MSIVEVFSLISSIASLVLAVIAIWLAMHYKRESDELNQSTIQLLMDVKADAKTISNVAMPELMAYGETMRNYVFQKRDETNRDNNLDLNQIVNDINLQLNSIKKERNLAENITQRIEKLEQNLKKSTQIIEDQQKQRSKKNVTIDFSEIGHGIIDTPIVKYNSFQDFLNMIYTNFLSGIVDPWTYGSSWFLKDLETKRKAA